MRRVTCERGLSKSGLVCVPEGKVFEGMVVVCVWQVEPNLDWCVIDHALNDFFPAFEGVVVDLGGLLMILNGKGVMIVQCGIGVGVELYVCSEHDGSVCVVVYGGEACGSGGIELGWL